MAKKTSPKKIFAIICGGLFGVVVLSCFVSCLGLTLESSRLERMAKEIARKTADDNMGEYGDFPDGMTLKLLDLQQSETEYQEAVPVTVRDRATNQRYMDMRFEDRVRKHRDYKIELGMNSRHQYICLTIHMAKKQGEDWKLESISKQTEYVHR